MLTTPGGGGGGRHLVKPLQFIRAPVLLQQQQRHDVFDDFHNFVQPFVRTTVKCLNNNRTGTCE